MSKRVYIFLADGFECTETIAPIDVMFRAGIDLHKIAVGKSKEITSSHGLVTLHADSLIGQIDTNDGDAIILPGGYPGYINLRESEALINIVRQYSDRHAIIAAICGAPTVLAAAGVARGRNVTCHSSVIDEMADYRYEGKDVVIDDNIITAAGAGCSIDFALAIAERLVDSETMSRVRRGMEV